MNRSRKKIKIWLNLAGFQVMIGYPKKPHSKAFKRKKRRNEDSKSL